MPNYYAHHLFGQAVRDRLSPEVQKVVDEQRESYDCGQYGPDPLFFYHCGIPSRTVSEGHTLHIGGPRDPLERMREPIEKNMPYAMGFALGFLCHFMLDNSAHAYVYAHCSAETIGHLAMEGEFDRYLMIKNNINPKKVTPMPRAKDRAAYTAAGNAFETADGKKYRTALNNYYFLSRLLTVFQGTVFCNLVDLITKNNDTAARILLRKDPSPYTEKTTPDLVEIMEKTVDPAVKMTELAYDAYKTGKPLDFLPEENFRGQHLNPDGTPETAG